ncbi:MAG: methionine synthase [Oscillospiraceae bacterium]|nr:methionine synthase [Oscillospiraceae bacterium]
MEELIDEVLRYLSIRGETPDGLRAQVGRTAAKLTESLRPKHVYRAFPLERGGEGVTLAGSGVTLTGGLAKKLLQDCDTAVLLCCTLGIEFERRLRALERRDMGEAVIFDACGSAWVESGCDAAEAEIAERFPGRYLTDRFSPGYGDLPLSLQPSVLAALDAERRLGIHLSDSFLMTPSKSVTAVVGVSDKPQPARVRGCGYCAMNKTCEYRKGGTTCAV